MPFDNDNQLKPWGHTEKARAAFREKLRRIAALNRSRNDMFDQNNCEHCLLGNAVRAGMYTSYSKALMDVQNLENKAGLDRSRAFALFGQISIIAYLFGSRGGAFPAGVAIGEPGRREAVSRLKKVMVWLA